jgi:hypothetical protein
VIKSGIPTLIIILFFYLQASAENHAFIMGMSHDETFRNEKGILSLLSKSDKWKTKYLSSEKTDQSEVFTNKTYKTQIEDIKRKLASHDSDAQFKKDDQILIYIATHGNSKLNRETTHQIVTQESGFTQAEVDELFKSKGFLGAIEASPVVSLDELSDVITLAKAKGVKLAIVDQSCYSGNALNFGSNDTCIIGATNKYIKSYPAFSTAFAFEMQNSILKDHKKTSLEDIFLKSRLSKHDYNGKNSEQLGQPIINTPAGLVTQQFVDSLQHYLEFSTGKDFNKVPQTCENHDQIEKNKLDFLKASLKMHITDEKFLNEIIAEFRKIKPSAVKLAESRDGKKLVAHVPVKLCYSPSLKGFPCEKLSNGQQFKSYYCQIVYQPEKYKPLSSERCYNYSEFEEIDKKTEKVAEADKVKINDTQIFFDLGMVSENVKNQEWMDKFEKRVKLTPLPYLQEISSHERSIYDKLYKYFSKKLKDEPNPCADFVL